MVIDNLSYRIRNRTSTFIALSPPLGISSFHLTWVFPYVNLVESLLHRAAGMVWMLRHMVNSPEVIHSGP